MPPKSQTAVTDEAAGDSLPTAVGDVVRLYAGDDTDAPAQYGVVVALDPTQIVDLGTARDYGLPVETV